MGWQEGRQAERQAAKQAGRHTGRPAGRKAGRQAGRKAGGQEGRKECRRADMHVDRQTEEQKDRCTNIHTDNRNKDIQTYTERQTVKKYGYRLKNRQMYRKTNIHPFGTKLLYCTKDRHTDRQTDRTDRKE